LQVEVAARTAASKQPELAEKFLKFMVSPAFQNAIPTGNWMYPVTQVALPSGFEQLNKPTTALEFTPQQVALNVRHGLANGNAPSAVNPRLAGSRLTAATLMVAVALAAFLALWFNAPQGEWFSLWQDDYLWHVVRFSFWQAFLSAVLSVVPAIFLARALYRRRFPGRLALLRLCAMTLILPVLVAVFGILSVYGRQGWLASLWHTSGWNGRFRHTVCRAFCWRTSFSICRWPAACCYNRWRVFPANSGS
jgi:ABC-type maltose transport system permease subunit